MVEQFQIVFVSFSNSVILISCDCKREIKIFLCPLLKRIFVYDMRHNMYVFLVLVQSEWVFALFLYFLQKKKKKIKGDRSRMEYNRR